MDRQLAASQAEKKLLGMLKNYVADSACRATPATCLPGPGNGVNKWSLDDATLGIDDTSCVDCYALQAGRHDVTGVLPSWFAAVPYSGTLTYVVGTETINGMPAPSVIVQVDWSER